MEKNRDFDIGWGSNVITKMFRIMKVFICILILGLSTVSASTFSQVRVSLDMKNATLKEVLKEITKVTGMNSCTVTMNWKTWKDFFERGK